MASGSHPCRAQVFEQKTGRDKPISHLRSSSAQGIVKVLPQPWQIRLTSSREDMAYLLVL